MNSWNPVLAHARRPLILSGTLVALSLAVFFASSYWHEHVQAGLTQAQAELATRQAALTGKQNDLRDIQAHIDEFHALEQRGLLGRGDREGWVEQLLASQQRTGLPPTLTYALQASKPLSQQSGPTTDGTAQAPTTPEDPAAAGPRFHDLDLTLSDIHEEELLVLLQDYAAHVKGRFRVHACSLADPTPQGLSAQCRLRFFTVPLPVKTPGTT